MDVMLFSNSTNRDDLLLGHTKHEIKAFSAGREILFLPYGRSDHDAWASEVRRALGIPLRSAHEELRPARAIADAECVLVGGGNTFMLLDALYALGVMSVVRERVFLSKTRYIGFGSGTAVASPSIRTALDAPVVEPPSFLALSLVPFQIVTHFDDAHTSSYPATDESCNCDVQRRVKEFHEVSSVPVLGLREGSRLVVEHETARVAGDRGAVLYLHGETRDVTPEENISYLLRTIGEYDARVSNIKSLQAEA
jgi:dipeptidase E